MSEARRTSPLSRWVARLGICARLLMRFVVELVIANLEQARLVLSIPLRVEPRWIRYQTRLQGHLTRTLLGALISLTPGTLTCDLDGDVLLVHALSARSDAEATDRIREKFESLLLRWEATR